MPKKIRNSYQDVYERLHIPINLQTTAEQAELMMTQLGLLYNTFGHVIRDVTKLLSFKYPSTKNLELAENPTEKKGKLDNKSIQRVQPTIQSPLVIQSESNNIQMINQQITPLNEDPQLQKLSNQLIQGVESLEKPLNLIRQSCQIEQEYKSFNIQIYSFENKDLSNRQKQKKADLLPQNQLPSKENTGKSKQKQKQPKQFNFLSSEVIQLD